MVFSLLLDWERNAENPSTKCSMLSPSILQKFCCIKTASQTPELCGIHVRILTPDLIEVQHKNGSAAKWSAMVLRYLIPPPAISVRVPITQLNSLLTDSGIDAIIQIHYIIHRYPIHLTSMYSKGGSGFED